MADIARHIEVVAPASVSRRIESYRARIEITVTTRKQQSCLDESLTLRDRVMSALTESGIADDDIEEGGGHVTQSSWSSSKTVVHSLQVSNAEMSVLVQAMANVEHVFATLKHRWFSGVKRDFSFSVPTPEFADDPNAAEKALKNAVANARVKATILAEEAGVKLGKLLAIVEEQRPKPQATYAQQLHGTDDLFDEAIDVQFCEMSSPEPPAINYSAAATRQGTARAYFRVRFVVEEGA